ncbi:MAG TPA: metallophosphoesterase [Thermomicrobiales bacterium]|jgi:predicted MPP superfamily phosphohydrolase|nr:metallophosphoesterase [Thermomicrobiales bacterium]
MRALLRKAAALSLVGAVGVVAGAGLYARFIHPFRPRVNHQFVELPRAHKHLDGVTIAFVTDLHVGPHFTAEDLEPTIQALRHLRADIVLFGGDYISESPRYLADVQEPLTRMASTARIGSWGMLGNHDVANIRSRVMEMLEPTGIRILTNESVEIETGKGPLWLVGIDDILLGHADLDAAFAGVPADAPRIAMWHEPDRAELVEPYGPFLLLSGHTHGGQVRLPIVGPIATPKLGKRYVSGRFTFGDMTLFVSNGIGMYRPPVRFNCPPEIVVFTLVA